MNAKRARVEGFLSLEQAAQQLDFSVSELSRQIEEGRVVAIVREGSAWLSTGEVTRLKRQSERASESGRSTPVPLEGSRLHRASRLTASITPNPASEVGDVKTPLATSSASGSPLVQIEAAPRADKSEEALPLSPSIFEQPSASDAGVVLSVIPKNLVPEVSVGLEANESSSAESEPIAVTPTLSAPVTPRPTAPPTVEPEAPVAALPTSQSSNSKATADRDSQQIRDLNKRCAELEARNQELDNTVGRLKSGLAETEATLKRNRIARGNLENEVIGLQDQLGKARTRSEALEREVQHLGAELDRVEEVHAGEMRRARSVKDRSSDTSSMAHNSPDLEDIRQRMLEKDRLLTQEYEQRAALRSQLEEIQQKYFELKAIYDKEKGDWSDVFAKSVQNQNLLREQIEELKIKSNPKGWNPFRRDK